MKNILFLFSIIFLKFNVTSQIGGFSAPIKLGSEINSEAEETMPVLSKDGKTLYFSRAFDPNSVGGISDQDIWYSSIENETYSPSKKLDKLNNKFNNVIFGINNDGDLIYLLDTYNGKKDDVRGSSYSRFKDKNWEKPVHVEIPPLQNDGDFFGFYIEKAGSVAILSFTGPGSLGEEDLYVSTKTGDTWSTPTHMGGVINTTGFEISPFLSPSLDTLFFSSNGLGGEGDVDIFYSIKQQGSWTDWSKPVNLGPLVNSTKYDAFFTMEGNHAFWASTKESEKADIFSSRVLPIPPFEASMFQNLSTIYGDIDLNLVGQDEMYTIVWANGSTTEDLHGLTAGNYSAIIKDKYGRSVEVNFEVLPPVVVENKNTSNKLTQEQFNLLFKDVSSILFDVSKYDIRKDAKKTLDQVVKIMNDNPTLEVELAAHTDCQSGEDLNLVLSHNRAKKSAEYIKERITKPERINGKGYGESQLKVNCDCESEDRKTRCSKKQNQLNRRTEFIMKNENNLLTEDIASLSYQAFENKKGANGLVKQKGKKGSKALANSANTNNGTDLIETGKSESDLNTAVEKKDVQSIDNNKEVATKFRTDITVSKEQEENIKNGFYILQEGETLYRASINSKIPINEIRKLNSLKSNNVRPGTKLLLR